MNKNKYFVYSTYLYILHMYTTLHVLHRNLDKHEKSNT